MHCVKIDKQNDSIREKKYYNKTLWKKEKTHIATTHKGMIILGINVVILRLCLVFEK